jgi:hypothetical protein
VMPASPSAKRPMVSPIHSCMWLSKLASSIMLAEV